jgi:hypothetical protein
MDAYDRFTKFPVPLIQFPDPPKKIPVPLRREFAEKAQ